MECLSRGGAGAVFVEKDGRSAAVLESNLESLGYTARSRVLRDDVRDALERLSGEKQCFDLVFADPPYNKSRCPRPDETAWFAELLQSSTLASLLAKEGLLLIEHFKKDTAHPPTHLILRREYRFGDTVVSAFENAAGQG